MELATQALEAFSLRLAECWRPPPRLSLAEWADEHYALPAGDANAGRWRTLPYQRGILDAISDPGIERVTVMKSARVGYTRCFSAAVGYYIHHDPCPILIVQPTIDDAKKHSKEDIAPMLRDVPCLRGLVSEPKSRGSENTVTDKLFSGGSLSLIGANSPRGFRRTSRRVVIFDEVDGYPLSAGTEGDPYELGVRRTEYYYNRKIIAGSTPTIAGASRIEELFLDGDQRRRYLPCPQCGAFQPLRFKNLRWPERRPEAAHFICEANGCVIEDREKRDMDAAGEWRAEAPEHFTSEHRYASFHIWAAYSYSPNASWGQLAAEWVKAAHGGQTLVQTYINTVRGETFSQVSEAPDWERLYLRRENYQIGTVPAGGLFLTAGVDVQKDRLVYEVVAWGRGKTSWSVDSGALAGDTASLETGPWMQLDALLARAFPHEHGGSPMPIRMLAVDSGYNTQTVYAWARRHSMGRVVAIKGQESGGALVSAPTPVEVSARGRRLKRGYRVWPVCGAVAKSELYGWLRVELPTVTAPSAPGYCHFPQYGEEFFRELTAEQLQARRNRRGFLKLEWTLVEGRQNHALDARVYARAAASIFGLDRFTDSDWTQLEQSVRPPPEQPAPSAGQEQPAPPAEERRPPRQPWLRRQERGGWFQRR